MRGAGPLPQKTRITTNALFGALVVLAGCGVVKKVQSIPLVERLGLGVDVPCDINLYQQRRMAGAFLQSPVGTPGGTLQYVTGKPSKAPLPRRLVLEDSKIKRLSSTTLDDETVLKGSRKAIAEPIAGLGKKDVLPQAYQLSYRAVRVDYKGPLVVGLSPTAQEIPQSGQAAMSGPVKIVFTSTDAEGTSTTTMATGTFTLLIGYGTGRAAFSVQDFTVDDGPELPFAKMSWSRLGICAPRIVSSGQGGTSFQSSDGGRVALIDPSTSPAATMAFESSQFAADERPAPPGSVGGVFAIQGNTASITGVFLSASSP